MDVTSYLLGKKSGGGPTPTGTINITENGTHDVTNYASANVNVSGGSVDTLEGLNQALSNYLINTDNMPNNYETLTTQQTTLYSPSADHKNYAIFKDRDNKYRIAWLITAEQHFGVILAPNFSSYDYVSHGGLIYTNNYNLAFSNTTSTRFRSTNSYETLEECVNAIKSNNTTYESPTGNSNFRLYDTTSIVLSNAYVYSMSNLDFVNVQRISSNETIEVIS